MDKGARSGSPLLSLLVPSPGNQAGGRADPHTLPGAAQPGCELIRASGGEALSQLLGRAAGDWVLVVDDTLVMDAACLSALQDAARQQGGADVVYFDWRFRDAGLIAPDRQRAALTLGAAEQLVQGWPSPAATATLMRRRALIEAGGFDGRYRPLAPAEAALRLAQGGARFRRSPDLVLEYAPRRLDPAGLAQRLDEALRMVRSGQAALPSQARALAGAETGIFFHALGLAIGAGLQTPPLTDHPPVPLAPGFDAARACTALLDGIASACHIAVGAEAAGQEAAGWNRLRAAAEPALAALASRFAWPEFARFVLRMADRRLAARCRPGGALDLGAERTVTFDLGQSPTDLALDGGVERLQGIVLSQGGEVGRFHIAPTGPIARGDMAAILADFRGAAPAGAASPAPPGAAWPEAPLAHQEPVGPEDPDEEHKARQTLALIPEGVGAALELACRDGRFTRRLAGKVGQLTATDPSATALAQAAQRCRDLPSVRFARLDPMHDPLPQDLDLIVCMDALYDLGDIDALVQVADRIADALRPGGHLVMTHADLAGDRDSRQTPGFRWNHPLGARTIGQAFGEAFGLGGALCLVEEHRSALYRIQHFRKPEGGERPPAPIYRDIAFGGRLPAAAAAAVDWAGRPPDPAGLAPPGVPVLMYHRIAADATPPMARFATTPARFAEQMQWLAESGHVTIGLEALEAAIWDGATLPERAVVLTFDDGYQDNLANAAPILRDLGQRATAFVPTAHVGRTADWDRLFGPPAPLMDWGELERLRRSGFDIASHGQRHRPMTALPPRELADELEGAREVLLARLGTTTNFLAYPYGDHDEAVQRAAMAAGYRLAFTTENRRWRPGERVATIPRLAVAGGLTTDEFAALVGSGPVFGS